MKTTFKMVCLSVMLSLSISCKKKVEPPSSDARGRELVYIDVAGKKYLMQTNYKFYTAKSQRGKYTYNQNAKIIKFSNDTTLAGYSLYSFNIQIDSQVDNLFYGGFDLQYWYKDPTSPIYIHGFNPDRYLPNPSQNWESNWVKILSYDYFKINEIRVNNGKHYINFETSYQIADSIHSPEVYTAYWKGDTFVYIDE